MTPNVKSSDSRTNSESNTNPHLDRILNSLRPFQREAYSFAVHGSVAGRQWSPSIRTNSSCGNSSETNDVKTGYGTEFLGRGRLLICDEMGLGKTITSLAIMTHYMDEWPLLILCPASLRYTWPGEIEKFLPGIPSSSVYVMQGFDDADVYENPIKRSKVKIVVATYSLLQNRSAAAKCLEQFNFRCVIVDESHNLKQRKSQRTALALPLLQKADRLVLLSGTPALARPVELWTQVFVIAPKLFGNYTPFTLRYCDAKRDRFGWNVNGLSHADELHEKLRQIMVRRLKADVLHELPPKVRSIVPVKIPKSPKRTESMSVIKALCEMRQSVDDLVGEEANGAHFEARRLLMQAYQASGIAKADAVCDYCLDWLRGSDQQQKVLIFAHHAAVMDAIEMTVAKELKGVGHIRIDGTVSAADRAVRVRKFQTSGQIRVAVLSMTAAGVGLTLTAASSVIFAELHWTPGVLAQCEDRAHRIGQPNSVNVIYLICEDSDVSIDNQLWKMLSKKVSSLGKVIDGQRGVSLQAKYEDKDAGANGCKAGMSGQDELSNFFADASTSRNKTTQQEPAKGSILTFFSKKTKTGGDCDEKGVSSTMHTPSAKQSSEHLVEWSCSACTFNNSRKTRRLSSLACSMCGTMHNPQNIKSSLGLKQVTPELVRTLTLLKTERRVQDECSSGSKRAREPETMITSSTSDQRSQPKGTSIDSNDDVIVLDDGDDDNDNDGDEAFIDGTIESSNVKYISRKKSMIGGNSSILSFTVSKNTGRVMIHCQLGANESLVNFDVDDVLTEECTDALMEAKLSRLPSNHAYDLRFDDNEVKKLVERLDCCRRQQYSAVNDQLACEIREYVKEYMSLREVEKKWLQESGVPHSGLNLRQNVIRQMPKMTANSTSRYTGGARERARENARNGTPSERDLEVIDGLRCANCGGTMSSATRHAGVQSTYCSVECRDAGQINRGGMYSSTSVRRHVFGLEGGVCQICRIHAYELYTRILALRPSERLNTLLAAGWTLPQTAKSLERLLQDPKEGDFWQADHIHAVAEGGGGCDLSNYRTLCVPCHKSVTERLHGRLKLTGGPNADATKNSDNTTSDSSKRQTDIRSMFQQTKYAYKMN